MSNSLLSADLARKWLQRVYGIALWAWILNWILGPFAPAGSVASQFLGVPLYAVVLGFVGIQAVYLLTLHESIPGLKLTSVFLVWYLGYHLLFPLLVLAHLSWIGWRSYDQVAYNPDWFQRGFISLLPYALTLAIFIFLRYANSAAAGYATLSLAAVDAVFISVSLTTWILSPFHWGTSFIEVLFDFVESHVLNGGDSRDLKRRISRYRRTHSRTLNIERDLKKLREDDVILLFLFIRKFAISGLHMAVVFGFVHYAVGATLCAPGQCYEGLSVATQPDEWFGYFYYATMTLITAEVNATPVSLGARVVTGVNALIGVGFLVILVTAFSMLSREKLSERMGELLTRVRSLTEKVEVKIIDTARQAIQPNSVNGELLDVLSEVEELKHTVEHRKEELEGVIREGRDVARSQHQDDTDERASP